MIELLKRPLCLYTWLCARQMEQKIKSPISSSEFIILSLCVVWGFQFHWKALTHRLLPHLCVCHKPVPMRTKSWQQRSRVTDASVAPCGAGVHTYTTKPMVQFPSHSLVHHNPRPHGAYSTHYTLYSTHSNVMSSAPLSSSPSSIPRGINVGPFSAKKSV